MQPRDFPARAIGAQARVPLLSRATDTFPPWLLLMALALCALGYGTAFLVVPVDPAQGTIHRIVFIHVPATWLALALFALLALCAAAEQFVGARVAPRLVEAIAPTGALFAFLAFWTGSLWGKPVWGAWVVLDMRLVADAVLLSLYVAITVTHLANPARGDRIAAVLALAGAAIVPLTLVSVALWPSAHAASTLHAQQTVPVVTARSLALATIVAGFLCYAGAAVLLRLRCVTLERAFGEPAPGQVPTA